MEEELFGIGHTLQTTPKENDTWGLIQNKFSTAADFINDCVPGSHFIG